jgi:hypothetical protein
MDAPVRFAGPSKGWRATASAACQAEAKQLWSNQNRGRQWRKIAVAGCERQAHLQLQERVRGAQQVATASRA